MNVDLTLMLGLHIFFFEVRKMMTKVFCPQ
jgi:hypothetical protein